METRTISNRHIIWIAAGFVLLMFIAFTPTYFSPMVKGTFDGLPIFHLHGALFFAWPVLFLLQAILAEQGRLNLHRSLGLVGIVLATSMFFTGIAAVARDLRVNEYGLALIAFAGLIMFSPVCHSGDCVPQAARVSPQNGESAGSPTRQFSSAALRSFLCIHFGTWLWKPQRGVRRRT